MTTSRLMVALVAEDESFGEDNTIYNRARSVVRNKSLDDNDRFKEYDYRLMTDDEDAVQILKSQQNNFIGLKDTVEQLRTLAFSHINEESQFYKTFSQESDEERRKALDILSKTKYFKDYSKFSSLFEKAIFYRQLLDQFSQSDAAKLSRETKVFCEEYQKYKESHGLEYAMGAFAECDQMAKAVIEYKNEMDECLQESRRSMSFGR